MTEYRGDIPAKLVVTAGPDGTIRFRIDELGTTSYRAIDLTPEQVAELIAELRRHTE